MTAPQTTRKFRLVLAYDGTDFHGWQRQAGVRTVQAEVEQVLRHILRHPLHVDGASRTDAGVHARGQVASVLTSSPIPLSNFRRALAHHLPPDIALVHGDEVCLEFHPSFAARGKLYRYRIHNTRQRPVELLRQRQTWHVWYPMDLDRLRAAAASVLGTHDFSAFASQGSTPRRTTVRTIERLDICRRGDELLFDVAGDGFLYNQVRNMVGTLYEIGRGHWEPERMAAILASGNRAQASITAPPQGLCLQWVRYDAPGAADGRTWYGRAGGRQSRAARTADGDG